MDNKLVNAIVEGGTIETIRDLLRKGANPNVQIYNKSAIGFLLNDCIKNESIIHLLKLYGAIYEPDKYEQALAEYNYYKKYWILSLIIIEIGVLYKRGWKGLVGYLSYSIPLLLFYYANVLLSIYFIGCLIYYSDADYLSDVLVFSFFPIVMLVVLLHSYNNLMECTGFWVNMYKTFISPIKYMGRISAEISTGGFPNDITNMIVQYCTDDDLSNWASELMPYDTERATEPPSNIFDIPPGSLCDPIPLEFKLAKVKDI